MLMLIAFIFCIALLINGNINKLKQASNFLLLAALLFVIVLVQIGNAKSSDILINSMNVIKLVYGDYVYENEGKYKIDLTEVKKSKEYLYKQLISTNNVNEKNKIEDKIIVLSRLPELCESTNNLHNSHLRMKNGLIFGLILPKVDERIKFIELIE